MLLRETPLIQEFIQEGRVQGRIEGQHRGERRGERRGECRGERKGARRGLLVALDARFGTLPPSTLAAVNKITSPAKLIALVRLTVTAGSLPEVLARLESEAAHQV
jgi:hypothetical protein